MTLEVLKWCSVHMKGRKGPTIEVGSYNVNGSPREFSEGKYFGIDMRPGPGVDEVANGHNIPFPSELFETAICVETLEHDDDPRATLAELYRVLRPGGLLIVTVPGIMFPRHDYPSDYWRFTPDGLRVLLREWHDVQVEENGATLSVKGIAWKR